MINFSKKNVIKQQDKIDADFLIVFLFDQYNYERKIRQDIQFKIQMDKTTAVIATLLIALIGFSLTNVVASDNLTKDPPKTVPYVQVSKYFGTWYQQSVIPFFFERNCEKTAATYSANQDGTIRVDNVCYRNGVKHESVGKAFPDPSDLSKSNAKLKVEFSSTFDIEANYWIVRLDKDYTYSVVSSPNYNYLWILYRQPVMPESLYQSIYKDLQKDGFPVEKLRRTKQTVDIQQ